MLKACALPLCGYDSHMIAREMDWSAREISAVKPFVSICTPRRWGKTVSVSMFCAAAICACDVNISIFSTGRRASESLLRLVLTYFNEYNDTGICPRRRIDKSNNEKLVVKTASSEFVALGHNPSIFGREGVCNSFPSNKKST